MYPREQPKHLDGWVIQKPAALRELLLGRTMR